MKLKYVVIYERTPNNYSAYSPDLPGCISTGKTWEEIQENIRRYSMKPSPLTSRA